MKKEAIISTMRRIFPAVVLLILAFFLLGYFDLKYILSNTTPTGGDTPAHNYLAKHLKDSFFGHGQIISYAKGWWCGFPMYQYYFFLPYLAMAGLSFIIPFNIAFKIISILGILCLPIGVYFSFKWMKFEQPTPLLAAIITIPFLFVDTHTMWGVNIYSTLAGEISNSISFVIFVLFLGSFYQDMAEAKFRLRSVGLFTLLFFTHFFTSVIAGGTCFFLIFLFDRSKFRERLLVFINTYGLTFLLAAWWIVPMLSKGGYAMEFGGDWDTKLWSAFPAYSFGLLVPALLAVYEGTRQKKQNIIFIVVLLILSVAAFYTGGKINASFTNVRFWPFIFYGVVCLSAIGLGEMIREFRAKELLVIAGLILTLMAIGSTKNNVQAWVKWNYEGLEGKSDYSTFRDLVLPLDNTPGRLANDLHEYNNHLGSTRVFETVPALINKDILEGGIVNSASGSMFSYYIQGETSINCAGFPTVVNPTTFNINNATKHLKLANVKHFIAHWDKTRQALSKHPEWKLLKTRGEYQLFELMTNDGRYVYIPKNNPLPVKTKHWQETAMEWIYTLPALDIPFILAYSKTTRQGLDPKQMVSEEEYLAYLASLSEDKGEIPVWLTLGPYYFSSRLPDEQAIEQSFVDLNKLKPAAGVKQFGRVWKPILRRGPVFLDNLYQPKQYFVNYNFVNIYSERDQSAWLDYSNDDSAKIYLNDQLIVKTGITGLNNYRRQRIFLRRGWNPLVYQLEQSVGGVFFHARIVGRDERPLKDIQYSIFAATGPSLKTRSTSNALIQEMEVSDQRISFKTSALHQPHIIKMSYFPNWQVKGARHIYHVTPNYMLVYPEQEVVTLYYGKTLADRLGALLSVLGLLGFIGLLFIKRK